MHNNINEVNTHRNNPNENFNPDNNPGNIKDQNLETWKKPKDIYLITAHNQCIVHEAISPKVYNKLYYTTFDKYKSGDTAYRIKEIRLPINRESTTFTNVHTLWEHLVKVCGYKQF